jgi:hypothetical protein
LPAGLDEGCGTQYSSHAYRLESGKLRLTCEDAGAYRAAADHLHETCETVLDLTQPITIDELILLRITHAAIEGDLKPLDRVIAKIEAEIRVRKRLDS